MTEDEKIEKLKLTPDQQKAFNRMKKSLKDFEKLGGVLVGSNDFQYALNGNNFVEVVDAYENEPSDKNDYIRLDDACLDGINIADPFIDASPWIKVLK